MTPKSFTTVLCLTLLPACGADRTISDTDELVFDQRWGDGEEDEDEVEPCAVGTSRECDADAGPGEQFCQWNERWSECYPYEDGGGEGDGTPLVLAFSGERVEFVADANHEFAISRNRSNVTDWPTAATPWLALDRNGNGQIDDGGELFGSATILESGRFAPNGFVALGELDDDGDGSVSATDALWSSLVLWRDFDGDRRSNDDELTPIAATGLRSIAVRYTLEPNCDARGNCEIERATMTWNDDTGRTRTGAVIDIHLRYQ